MAEKGRSTKFPTNNWIYRLICIQVIGRYKTASRDWPRGELAEANVCALQVEKWPKASGFCGYDQ